VQFAPAATELPQVLLCRKSPGFAPPKVMLVMPSEAPPVLLSVTFCAVLTVCKGWLLKVRLVGERPTIGLELTPVPVSVAGMGETAALNVTFTVAVKVPVACGVNVTLMPHDAPAAMVKQLLV